MVKDSGASASIEDIEANTKYVVFPKEHLGLMVGNYLYQVGILDKDSDKIESLTIPVEVDSEGLITIRVSLIEGWKAEMEGETIQ